MKTNKLFSTALVAMLFLSTVMLFSVSPAKAATTYVSVIDAIDGDTNFIYSNLNPPTGGVFTVNITVTDVVLLAGWQVNLTWDPTLLTIADPADVYLPADHIFKGLDPQTPPKDINNMAGYVAWACAIGPAAPVNNFNGSGTMMCVKFTVIKIPSSAEPLLSCNLVLDRLNLPWTMPTMLVNPDAEEIPFTEQNGYYEYSYIKPPPSKPWLEASPKVKVVGEPLGPPLVGTTRAFFTVDIVIKNVTQENDLIGVQNIAFQFPRDFITIHNPVDISANVTEGTFMNNPLWAPYGTTFIYVIDWDYPPGYNTISIGLIINPNPDTGEYDWTARPEGEGVLCTIYFEVIYQEALPWEGHTTLDIEPLFPGEMFLNSTEGWIEYLPPVDGEIIVKGYVVGRMLDVYVGADPDEPYPYPLGGQGPNGTADMFWPQKKIYIWAFASYNFWPEQNKVVTFEIRDPDWNIVTVLSGVTDENGIARASFRIPWPEHEKYLCQEYTIIASVDIACEKVWDWLRFHFDYLVRWEKVTIEPAEVKHCEYVTVTVTIKSKAIQNYRVLITIDLKDELQYPIGFDMAWIEIGGAEYCHYKVYDNPPIVFRLHIGKHAHAGVATAHINALSALPSLCGYAWCPEYVDPQTGEPPTFFILAEWA